ncbi:MAG: cell division protein FtsQ/DivIB [Betaproteobacteria bacterium]
MRPRRPRPVDGMSVEDVDDGDATRPGGRGEPTRRLAPLAFVVLLVASAGFTFLRSPYFHIQHIDVRGLTNLSTEEVVVACGLAEDENIFDVDLRAITTRLKAIPRVDKVQVSRRLPSTIVIDVRERLPVAVIPYAGYFVEIDAAGLAIDLEETYRGRELPLVTGLALRSVKVGHPVDAPEISSALTLIAALPASVLQQVSEVNFSSSRGFCLYMQSGTQVIVGVGTGEELRSRATVLDALLARLEQEGTHATYIDVRFEKRPVVRTGR